MKSIIVASALFALGGCTYVAAKAPDASTTPMKAEQVAAASLVRTQLADTDFQQLFPGVAVHFVYGGIGLGVPTAQLGRIDAGLTFPPHSHSDDYHAVLIKGRFQHWEVGDADKGPVMLPGATFFQGKDVPHYDSCLGPEQCVVYVTFAHRADVTMAQ